MAIGSVVFDSNKVDERLIKRVEKLEETVKEIELANANIISDYEQLLTICHTLKVKYKELRDSVDGTRVSRIIT